MNTVLQPGVESLVVKAAKHKGGLPRDGTGEPRGEQFNPLGYTHVADSAAYVPALRRQSRRQSDDAFLNEIEAWQKSRFS